MLSLRIGWIEDLVRIGWVFRCVGYLGWIGEMAGLDICMCFTISCVGELVVLG